MVVLLSKISYIAAIVVVIVGLLCFIKGHDATKALKLTSAIIVIVFLVYIIIFAAGLNMWTNSYYESQIKNKEVAFRTLLIKYEADSAMLVKLRKDSTKYKVLANGNDKEIDSLKNDYKKNHNITDSLKNYITKLSQIIYKIKKYPEAVQRVEIDSANETFYNADKALSALDRYIQKAKNHYDKPIKIRDVLKNFKGFAISGNTSDFQVNYLKSDGSEYLDINLKFRDDSLVNKIACIYLRVDKKTSAENDKHYAFLFEQAYKPQTGTNQIEIPNYLKQSHGLLNIGYVLKSESEKVYPHYEKITSTY